MQEALKINYEDLWKEDNGKEPKNHSPVLDYCRKLVKEGKPTNTKLEVFRKGELSMLVKNIGKAAKQAILENADVGPIFVKYNEISAEKLAKLRSLPRRRGAKPLVNTP